MGFDLSALKGIKTGTDVVDHVREIPIDQITPDPNQPRKHFDEQEIQELAQSIEENGLVQPIIVRKASDGFVIVAGERRYRACQQNGAQSIKAIVSKINDPVAIAYLQMIENLQRQDLNPAEVAAFICERLAQGDKQIDIAQRLGISKTRVSEYSNWEAMPEHIKDAVKAGRITNFQTAYTLFKQWKEHPENVESYITQSDSIITNQDVKTLSSEMSEEVIDTTENVKNVDSDDFDEAENEEDSFSESSIENEAFEEDLLNEDQEEDEDHEQDSTNFNLQSYTEKDLIKEEVEEYRKPLILVTVGKRSGELLYKRKTTDGFTAVRWEDGSIENVYSEDIRINRIVEA